METSWNATQQTVTDHRRSLETAAREQRFVKRVRRTKRQRRRAHRLALGRVSDPGPSTYQPHPAT